MILFLLGRLEAGWIYNNLGAIELSRGLVSVQTPPPTLEMRLDALSKAQGYFQQAALWKPGQPRFVHNLLTVHLQRGDLYGNVADWDQAIASYKAALDVDGTSAEAYRKLGEIFTYRKPHEPQYLDQAIQYLDQAVALSPNFGYQRIVLGHALWFRGRKPEAITRLKASISLSPNGYNWTVLGGFYVAEKDWDAAMACYQNALGFEADRVDTWFGIGVAYAGKGNHAEAISAWRKVVELAPGSELAQAAQSKIMALGQ